ncbi:MAG: JDVT-CTERM system glutamic-type intramembrane protease [Pseudomonadota bacterium]
MNAPAALARDGLFYLALLAGPLCWLALFPLLAPQPAWGWPLRQPALFLMPALVYPVLEEIAFRGLLQELLRERLGAGALGPLTHANLLTSAVFTLLHFLNHPPLWAALVLLPSLVFGYFKDRTRALTAPVILHVFYNSGFLWLFAAPG